MNFRDYGNDRKSDPVNAAGITTPGRELMSRFGRQADGFPSDVVIDAAANVVINGVRQAYGDRRNAEARFDELFGKMKQLLLNHYDSVTGKRRNGVFPFTQGVEPTMFHDKDGFGR